MRYFPRISPKFPQNSPRCLSKYLYSKLCIGLSVYQKKMISFVFGREFRGFNLIYWTPMRGSYFLYGSNMEKCDLFLKNGRFFGRIWPDWGNSTWADMAGLGSIGLNG